ncbi:hypothetical protein AMJ87_02035 [candidate division WOR_3 bacterium SM23_60]|uniref:Uncharacterized protein n=1 Tax=candidate division WOR_3 bacterium SM23_60 TaxID=1703780 RepID=A0A0S8GK69_UNCW3|nr:MAG: hypothetical protein AMJ87_02035 [candidate division WOR_3 bacterium SM23_60]
MRATRVYCVFLVIVWCVCSSGNLEVELTTPADGSLVGGRVAITADVSATYWTDSVHIFINDSLSFSESSYPYVFSWDTYPLQDSSRHTMYAIAYSSDKDDAYSDTISVTIYNGATIFADDFEQYVAGDYPWLNGWYTIWDGAGDDYTYIEQGVAFGGSSSFKLRGLDDWPRTDGVDLYMVGVNKLTYECAVMIPDYSYTGALLGFYVELDPTLGTVVNGVLFDYADSTVHVRGTTNYSTGFTWQRGTWYLVRVELDYGNDSMDVWISDQQIASNLVAAPRDTSHTFALATEYGINGSVNYDELSIYEHD